MSRSVRVLVVDDSALIRKMLSDLLGEHPEIEVVGTAQDGAFVMRKIEQLQPDVVTLDVEMRTKGGLEVLPEIVKTFGVPVIMVSAHTEKGAKSTLQALELGAVDFVTKPQSGMGVGLNEIVDSLSQKILAVGRSKRRAPLRKPASAPFAQKSPGVRPMPRASAPPNTQRISGRIDMIAVGASTGGPEAIKNLLTPLPNNLPGIVIVQHMPAGFTRAFSDRMNTLCAIHVKEAEDGDPVQTGTCLIAPGSRHMEVVPAGSGWRVRLLDTPPVNRHRPAVDVLFHSVAQRVGRRSIAVILTGMGADGALGMKAIHDTGALTVAQDQDSCVVFGMPKEAIRAGGARQILPLEQIPPFLIKSLGAERVSFAAASV